MAGVKRFVICFDGTWQKLKQPKPTNIAIIARSIAHTNTLPDGTQIPQIVIYSQGVGSNVDALGKDGLAGLTAKLDKLSARTDQAATAASNKVHASAAGALFVAGKGVSAPRGRAAAGGHAAAAGWVARRQGGKGGGGGGGKDGCVVA